MGFKSLNSCRKRPCLERVTNVWMKFRRPKYKAFEETLRKLLPFKEWCLEATGALHGLESPPPMYICRPRKKLQDCFFGVVNALLTNKELERQPVLTCQ